MTHVPCSSPEAQTELCALDKDLFDLWDWDGTVELGVPTLMQLCREISQLCGQVELLCEQFELIRETIKLTRQQGGQ